jgi:hypothetical protein
VTAVTADEQHIGTTLEYIGFVTFNNRPLAGWRT